MVDLLPCPFCGSHAEAGRPDRFDDWYVRCQACDATIEKSSLDGAITAWNRRDPVKTVKINHEWARIGSIGTYPIYRCSRCGVDSPSSVGCNENTNR